MKINDVVNQRLINQQIAATRFTKPEQLVSYLGAMQAQEYAMAKWAIGLRLPGYDDAAIENAFNAGKIIRTHVMRPTWHFVAPADIHWLLKLTGPRVNAINGYYYRKFELNNLLFKQSNKILIKVLEGNNYLTRAALKAALEKEKIKADGLRLGYIMMHAELEGIICSGPRIGKQFTYALLDERVSDNKLYDYQDALRKLASRYFTSRSPATLQDFVWWSGLTMKEARLAIEALPTTFLKETINGKTYIISPLSATVKSSHQTTFLMPDYDEYGISYKDRSALFDPKVTGITSPYSHMIIIDGIIAGTWQRLNKKDAGVYVDVIPFMPLSKKQQVALAAAIRKYCSFFKGAKE